MFLLFAYPGYYPSGGIDDCLGQFETIDAAIEHLDPFMILKDNNERYDYVHIYDITQDTIVLRGKVVRDEHYQYLGLVESTHDDFYNKYGYDAKKG